MDPRLQELVKIVAVLRKHWQKKYQKYSRDSHDANDSCLSNVYRIHPHPSHRPKHLVNVVYNIYNLDMFPTCSQRQAKQRRICCKIASAASMSLLHRSHRWLVVDQPLWKIMEWVTVGMMTFPIYAKIKKMFHLERYTITHQHLLALYPQIPDSCRVSHVIL